MPQTELSADVLRDQAWHMLYLITQVGEHLHWVLVLRPGVAQGGQRIMTANWAVRVGDSLQIFCAHSLKLELQLRRLLLLVESESRQLFAWSSFRLHRLKCVSLRLLKFHFELCLPRKSLCDSILHIREGHHVVFTHLLYLLEQPSYPIFIVAVVLKINGFPLFLAVLQLDKN